MGDRLTAMKAAFQSQYKSHCVAASLSNQKAGSSAAGASGWTGTGSLNSVPTNSAQQGHNSPDNPIPSAAKSTPGFGNTGNISSAPVTYPSVRAQGVNNTASGNISREGIGSGNGKRERYTKNRGGGHHSHGESSNLRGDSPRSGDGGRPGDGYRRYPESSSSRHTDGHWHGENRHGGSTGRHGESRSANDGGNGESRKEGCNPESKVDPKVDSSKMNKWTARQIRQQMVSLSLSHPSARKVHEIVRMHVL
ncbi:ATP-dependent RNA helicase DDX42 [Sciurus carolinensis]|uniref:ATP-dependent RNA helicase DDX42 n=1 Tax=Sciurus carolinensis TaxID=30640 RepID=A0AA41T1A9_SCICA|nr:ATP-dependent RNA helicase DDX42 [Sciurus carolinensis]